VNLLAGNGVVAKTGAAIATADDWVVVGAPGDGVSETGQVYVYHIRDSASADIVLAQILSPGTDVTGQFGLSVAVSGDVLIVGDPTNGKCAVIVR
jgi:hypothetical protein